MVMVRKKEGRRAKVAGMCVIAYGKFQPSGISGNWSVTYPVTFLEMPNGWKVVVLIVIVNVTVISK